MWLRELRVRNLKRLRDFTLDLKRPDGSTRMWTILIGRNGTGKSSILQAAALAAAGNFRADDLVRDARESLPDKRLEKSIKTPRGGTRIVSEEVSIAADFMFGPVGRYDPTSHPFKRPDDLFLFDDGEGELLRSRTWIRPDRAVQGSAQYVDSTAPALGNSEDKALAGGDRTADRSRSGTRDTDPLVAAREDDLAHWFVAGYGVQRDLPETALTVQRPERPSIDRLRPLFGPRQLIGPNFQALFDSKKVALAYASLLRDVLLRIETLVPGIVDIELRGKGGVTKAEHLTKSHRFVQEVSGQKLKLPARWLSHGYQSSLAWIADLVGQVVLEAGASVKPERMEGLVLVDEIDLYLHPTWQVGLIHALRETFPKLQFIATTHSPILLSAFRRDEVVMLDFDAEGNVVQVPTPRDPRLLTGSELYEWFFGIDKLYPADLGEILERYTRLATDPSRTPEEHATAERLREELHRQDIDPGIPLDLPRKHDRAG